MPRVVVDGRSLHVDTGGPEALAQLAVALGPQTFLLRPSKAPPVAPRIAREYPSISRLAILRETSPAAQAVRAAVALACKGLSPFLRGAASPAATTATSSTRVHAPQFCPI